jgi:hypothetical protein
MTASTQNSGRNDEVSRKYIGRHCGRGPDASPVAATMKKKI